MSFDIPEIHEDKKGRPESHIWNHYIKKSLGSDHYSAKCHYCAFT